MVDEEQAELEKKRQTLNQILTGYAMDWSNLDSTVAYKADHQLALPECVFECPKCGKTHWVESMYLFQQVDSPKRVYIQSLSTFFDMKPDGEIVGLSGDFVLGASQITMLCGECLTMLGIDVSDVEVITPGFPDERKQ